MVIRRSEKGCSDKGCRGRGRGRVRIAGEVVADVFEAEVEGGGSADTLRALQGDHTPAHRQAALEAARANQPLQPVGKPHVKQLIKERLRNECETRAPGVRQRGGHVREEQL